METDRTRKYALIAANFIGFFHFLWNDVDMLHEMGYEVYAMGDNEKQEEHTLKIMEEKNVTFIDAKIDSKSPFTQNNWDYYKKVSRLLKEHHFDLVHCHTPIVGILVRLAARNYRKQGTKVIYTTHGLAYTHLSSRKEYFIYHSIESLASRFCDAIITINKEDFENAKKLHCKKVFYINGVGVDCSKYCNVTIDRNLYRKQIGVAASDIMILSVGELSNRKNHVVIIKAIGHMNDKNKYVYVIAGKGIGTASTESLLIQTAQQYDVRLVLLGFRDDIPQLIHCSDIGAIPSIREGLGLAGIQSLCAGVPLVGTGVQGIKDYIVDGVTGYLCNPFDHLAFMRNIEKLSDAYRRECMRQNCHEMAVKFDIAISKHQMNIIYDKIL